MSNPYSADYHVIPDAIDEFSRAEILKVFQKMAQSRAFEQCIVRAGASGRFEIKVHMSSGQEAVSAALAVAVPSYQYFAQHRSMDLFLALGGAPERVRDEISCSDNGCCGGKLGGGFQIHEDGYELYTHTGFIGENISVGVGMALGNRKKTLCLFGDGAAEEDYALTAYGFAVTHILPVLFVCTDNELSVLSPLSKRRKWELAEVAHGFGMKAVDISDDPFTLMHWIREFEGELPALINVRVCRDFWHAGIGVDGPPRWRRFEIVRKQMLARGFEREMKEIETDVAVKMEEVWKSYL